MLFLFYLFYTFLNAFAFSFCIASTAVCVHRFDRLEQGATKSFVVDNCFKKVNLKNFEGLMYIYKVFVSYAISDWYYEVDIHPVGVYLDLNQTNSLALRRFVFILACVSAGWYKSFPGIYVHMSREWWCGLALPNTVNRTHLHKHISSTLICI